MKLSGDTGPLLLPCAPGLGVTTGKGTAALVHPLTSSRSLSLVVVTP